MTINRRFAPKPASVSAALAMILSAGSALGFDLEAHRGGRALLPENTLPAFANALSMGVDTLELDMGVTKDGVVVVSHERGLNPDITRGPDGAYIPKGIPFLGLTFEEVGRYDVGRIKPDSAYARAFPDQRPIDGTRIPSLAQVFALVRKSGDAHVRLNIETKIDPGHPEETVDPERFVTAVLDLLKREGFEDRVMIQSFDWRTLRLVQDRAPRIPTVYLTIEKGDAPNVRLDKPSPWTAGFDPMRFGGSLPQAIKAAGGRIWSPLALDVTPERLAEAHGLGLEVVVWTVNRREDMARLIAMGVDGIISDKPDLLRAVMIENGLTPPKPAPVSP